jgi:pimeloyl-ACP methyl ester carboxylesterase
MNALALARRSSSSMEAISIVASGRGVLPLLAPDCTVVAMDRRGHGQSGPYHTGHTLERDVEDALAVLDQVPHPTTLVGHSASAYIALEVALRSAHVARVVGA